MMPRLLKNSALLLFLVVSLRCNFHKEIPPPSRTLVVALCDFSSSTEDGHTQKHLQKNIGSLIQILPGQTTYYIYPVGAWLKPPLLKDSIGNKEEEESKNAVRRAAKAVKIVGARAAEPKPERTCIRSTLEAVSQQIELLTRRGAFENVHLFLFSDMQEACSWGPTFVNLEESRFKEANERLEANQVLPFFNRLPKNIEVTVFLNSGQNAHFENIMKFWNAYFKKAGYRKNIIYANDVPATLF